MCSIRGDGKREAGHLLKANMWDAAHSVITNKLVSSAVRHSASICSVPYCYVHVHVPACVHAYVLSLLFVSLCVCVVSCSVKSL